MICLTMRRYYSWIPSLYFFQALPFALVTLVAPIFYKNLKLDNGTITLITSFFVVPWILKPILSPVLEKLNSKKNLTIWFQAIILLLIICLALSLLSKHDLIISGILFVIIAFASAMHDIVSDSLYIINLTASLQAHFIGVRTLFYQLGKLVCHGGIVFAVGLLMGYVSLKNAWVVVLLSLATLTAILILYNEKFIPEIEKTKHFIKLSFAEIMTNFIEVGHEYLAVPNVVHHTIFILLFNLPEAQLSKIVPLFLLDPVIKNGLGLSTEEVGLIYGGIGTMATMIGVMCAGFMLSKIDIKRTLIPLTLFILITNMVYLFLSILHVHDLWLITALIAIAQIGFGLSNGVYMVYLLNIFTRGQYPMSIYALGTSLMALGIALACSVSGLLQDILGYSDFFIWILLANLGIIFMSIVNVRKLNSQ